MQLFLFVLLVLLYFSRGLKQLESTTLNFSTTDTNHSILKAPISTIKPECQRKCGNLTVPYPFGIVSKGLSCSIHPSFDITCNNSFNPPKAFIQTGNLEVYDISDTELRISTFISYKCYNQSGKVIPEHQSWSVSLGAIYWYSDVNVFTIVGCDDFASIYNARSEYPKRKRKGCMTTCSSAEEVTKNGCSGSGCCQVFVDVKKFFEISLASDFMHTDGVSSFNQCGYAFLGDKDSFKFNGTSDLNDSTFVKRIEANVPIVLDWFVAKKNCIEAVKDQDSYACKDTKSHCRNDNRSRGYLCHCNEGYEGNPYLSSGCHDIDECQQKTDHCEQVCNNTVGNYSCSCNRGYYLDKNDFRSCIPKKSKSQVIMYAFGIGFCCLFVIIGINWVYCIVKQRKHFQLREKYFEQNGGLLLRQHSISEGSSVELTKHYTYEELKKATNNYAADRIVGQGGNGIVYKGILPDQRVVAVKRSRGLDLNQVDQFINEVVILAQVNHRNVVKVLGCCLECEVPLLVYEFVSNGTLHHHVHSVDGDLSWLSLDNRLRIAAESSGALAYLHSAASMPIVHRDVKLANILLDDDCVSKISDFGASRLVPLDQTKVITLVQGTLGYLDPQYYHTGELTDKSDVYSFGVVLAELLTGRKPICMNNSTEEKSLAAYFITSLKENRIFQILDRRVVREGTIDQLEKAAQLVKRCLNFKGEERPTMKEVTMEIESLRKLSKHPLADAELKGHPEIRPSDLYEVQLSSYHNVVNDSEQYTSSSMSNISLLHPPSSPR